MFVRVMSVCNINFPSQEAIALILFYDYCQKKGKIREKYLSWGDKQKKLRALFYPHVTTTNILYKNR